MTFIYASLLIFLLTVFYATRAVSSEKKRIVSILRGAWPLLILNVLVKLPYGDFFLGLEYEDSYIWSVFARQVSYLDRIDLSSFTTQACAWGSMADCRLMATYDGHLISFSSLLFLVYQIFGYSPVAVVFVNIFFSTILLVLVLEFVCRGVKQDNFLIYCVGVLYSFTPAMSSFQASGLSETFSSTLVFLVLSLYTKAFHNEGSWAKSTSLSIDVVAAVIAFFYCITVKRENAVLIVLPAISLLLNGKVLIKNTGFILYTVITGILTVLFVSSVLSVTLIAEETEIHDQAFSFRFIWPLLHVYVGSLVTFNYFLITGYLCLLGIPFLLLKKNQVHIKLIVGCFLFFLLLYSFHYRSYYFVHNDMVNAFDALRYVNNLFPLLVIIAGVFLFSILAKAVNIRPWILGMLFLIGLYQTLAVKALFSEGEYEARVEGIKAAFDIMKPGDVLITDIPVCVQFFSTPDFIVFDLADEALVNSNVIKMVQNADLYYLEFPYHKEKYFVDRYRAFVAYTTEHFRFTTVEEKKGYVLHKVNNKLFARAVR
jgi:hypothetical protein